ncbi:DUF4382 domain-containing protein [Mangrovivirga sp. M17]|uniref:DUF4382 domain-containing protein n=1 Tax=Mangrovivirga halotolerans TaxID=2993936 RepID=A0ABT3RY50_9BACT|nr:DUF4382 domain-containing protein [Mangrovivirga halotolerans]MCX2746137.1 DUF4382 domain-containing protein [Mangrovivirga halotolerans]
MNLKIHIYFSALLLLLFTTGCTSETSESNINSGNIVLRISDSPADYQRLILDIEGAILEENSKQVHLHTTFTGQLDILDYNNGKSYLLAEEKYENITPQNIILILGQDNFITIKNKNYNIELPESLKNGIRIPIPRSMVDKNSININLDFNAAKSVIKKSGKFILKPVINPKKENTGGGVEGTITPVVPAVAHLILDSDTISSTYCDEYGYFFINNIEENKYTLIVEPTDEYEHGERKNVIVQDMRITNVGKIKINKK